MKKYLFSELIEEITELNTELLYGLNDIVGVTIEKGLIPTIANLTKTELNKFYVVKPDTFVFNPRTHGVRLGMGYNDTENTYITSWNNVAFKVKEEVRDFLNPQYLWLYFNRSEWDRETNYHAWGSSTIVFSWNTFRNLSIKLPEKEEQDKIVRQYNIIENRIKMKKQINDNLEATAYAIYKETFITSASEKWDKGTLSDLLTVKYGKDHKHLLDGSIPLYGSGGIMRYVEKSLYNKVSVLIPRKGTLSNVMYVDEPFWSVDTMFYTEIPKPYAAKFIYYFVKSKDLAGMDTGSAVPSMSSEIIHSMQLDIPDDETLIVFDNRLNPLYKQMKVNNQECAELKKLQEVLLATISSH